MKGKGEHLVASKMRWEECQRLKMPQAERSRNECQEYKEEDNRGWAVAFEDTTKRMLKYLEDSEKLKVTTRESREQVVAFFKL